MSNLRSVSGSVAEDLFIDIFADTFGAEKAGYLYSQFHFYDIYQNTRFADFALESGARRVIIEIDDEATHNKTIVSRDKFIDDMLKQNSMIHLGWDVFRWAVHQLQTQPDLVKDELRTFLGQYPLFKEIQDYLPMQKGKALDGTNLKLKKHQEEALQSLADMRGRHETIALLHHATGTGKTVTAVSDAKAVGKRTLFLAHTHELVQQAYEAFDKIWSSVTLGKYVENIKQTSTHVVCGSIQSVAMNLDKFNADDFGYLIIDESHHATAETYQRVLSFFKPSFTLGLTATPERTDDKDILEIFKNTAHKLDIKTAVEMGELVPIRCVRIHTNIDLTKVRINSMLYRSNELESKVFVPERNKLIVDTYLDFVKGKKTVVFCASVRHANEIADLFKQIGVNALAVSGETKGSQRKEQLAKYEDGDIQVLCACDLLNEGWDSPKTEVLFMARPTMSKVLYTQQLGRGMRTSDDKESLMVFDFVDNAGRYNMPFFIHRLFQLKDYRPGALAVAEPGKRYYEESLFIKGEKPDVLIDYPISATDYELVDIFNWQEEAQNMISQAEFVRRVDVQSETIEKYVRDGKIVPDLVVPMSDSRSYKYFLPETLERIAGENNWMIITDANRKNLFMNMVQQMDMSYSYKPVLLKAILHNSDFEGRVLISDIVDYFKTFYEERRNNGMKVEKANSIFAKGKYTDKEAERNILVNPFKRFEDMQILRHTKTLGIIEVDTTVWRNLTDDDKNDIETVCDEKLKLYYMRIASVEPNV